MAYDEVLADRVRAAGGDGPGMREMKMFGGIAWMDRGNMAFGILGDALMVRVGPDAWVDALDQPHAREMDFNGRSMRGMVLVSPSGTAGDGDLTRWLDAGLDFTATLPDK